MKMKQKKNEERERERGGEKLRREGKQPWSGIAMETKAQACRYT